MHHGYGAVTGELHVTLENLGAGLQSQLERGQGVFGSAAGIAAVGNQEGPPVPTPIRLPIMPGVT